jgi:hypothetical protein
MLSDERYSAPTHIVTARTRIQHIHLAQLVQYTLTWLLQCSSDMIVVTKACNTLTIVHLADVSTYIYIYSMQIAV